MRKERKEIRMGFLHLVHMGQNSAAVSVEDTVAQERCSSVSVPSSGDTHQSVPVAQAAIEDSVVAVALALALVLA